MELTLALDAGVVAAAPVLPGPGIAPDDPTAEAFAALLATLVASVAPQVPVALPVVEATATVVGEVPAAPAAPVLPLAVALPVAAAPGDAAEDEADPLLPAAATPVAADAPDAAPEVPAFSSPIRREVRRNGDENVESTVDVPVRAERPAAAPAAPVATATVTPEAVAPVAAPFSSPSGPDSGPSRDQNAPTVTPIANAPAVREILRPEIVSGPGAPPPAPPTPVEQVVRAVAPLRKLPDGTHHLTLELRPADLGVVRVELSLDHGMIHLGLQADTEGTSQLLRAALPELRSQLDTAGLLAGRLSVDDGGFGRNTEGQPTWRTDADGNRRRQGSDAEAMPEEPPATAYSSSAYGQIDVLL